MTKAIPVGVGIVNPNVSRLGRRRGVDIDVSAVCTHNDKTRGSRQSKEQRLGSIAAHASFASLIRLNDVILMGTQHCGARWGRIRHAKDVLRLVKFELFPFPSEPENPNRHLLQLAMGKGSKGLHVGCSFATDVLD
jgi:hypothetical protein